MPERANLACELARKAGARIREAAGRGRDVQFKSAVDLVTDVDRASQAAIVAGIREAFPHDAIVAEEDDAHARPEGPCWYIDPLDGTTNFVHGLPHFAVSIAYVAPDGPLCAAVYDPMKDELFRAARGHGAFLGDAPLAVSAAATVGSSLLVTGFPYDRREQPELYLAYFRTFLCASRDLRRFGSASLDLCYVAAGRFDGFFEWNLKPWDTAAGWLVAREAGGRVTDFDGSPYDPWLPRVLATNGLIHDEAVSLMAALPRSASS